MIKIVMTDLDGTLLNPEKEITKKTISVIKKFQNKGGIFVVNTGRGYATASKIIKEAGISCDYICLSGAGIYDDAGQCVKCDCMTMEEITFVRQIERKYELSINYLTSSGSFSEKSREWAESYYLQEAKISAEKSGQIFEAKNALDKYQRILNYVKFGSDIGKIIEDNIPIYKMVAMSMDLEQFQEAREELISCSKFHVAMTSASSLEINSMRVDKGTAAVDYIKSRGFGMQEVMVIGDSENDYAMLSLPFGKRVAMENGETEIKNICSDITLSNTEDGVAYAIEKWGWNR